MTAVAHAASLFDDFIKREWQDVFRNEVHVKLDNGSRYVPNGGTQGVPLLRENSNAFEEAIRIWSGPVPGPQDTDGYDRVIDQAGFEYTWEWFLIDPGRPWADAVPVAVRQHIKDDLARRSQGALDRKEERAAEAERGAEAKDDETIANMNADRAAQGNEPLTERQEVSVRESRRNRRAKGTQ
jgi:hypothetical protein